MLIKRVHGILTDEDACRFFRLDTKVLQECWSNLIFATHQFLWENVMSWQLKGVCYMMVFSMRGGGAFHGRKLGEHLNNKWTYTYFSSESKCKQIIESCKYFMNSVLQLDLETWDTCSDKWDHRDFKNCEVLKIIFVSYQS